MKFTIATLFALVAVASAYSEGGFPAGDTLLLRLPRDANGGMFLT